MAIRAARFFGALSLLGVGAVHLQQYIGNGYSTVPTIGTLFLLNAISAGVVGFALLLPLKRVLGATSGNAAIGALAVAGVGIAVGSLVALFISESGTLFGFAEHGYRTVIVIAIAVEALAAVLLTPLAAVSIRRALAQPERHGPRPSRPSGYAASRSA
jgi:hypothetical protein